MARQRYKMVHTSLRTSRKLAASEHGNARLYFHVLLASDAYGTLSGDPWDVFHNAVSGVRGFDVDVVEAGITKLVNVGLLERWTEDDGSVWLYVVNHDEINSKSQTGRRGARQLPKPPSQRPETRNSPELAGTVSVSMTSQHEANSEPLAETVPRGEEKGLSLGIAATFDDAPFGFHDAVAISKARRQVEEAEKFLPPADRSDAFSGVDRSHLLRDTGRLHSESSAGPGESSGEDPRCHALDRLSSEQRSGADAHPARAQPSSSQPRDNATTTDIRPAA